MHSIYWQAERRTVERDHVEGVRTVRGKLVLAVAYKFSVSCSLLSA